MSQSYKNVSCKAIASELGIRHKSGNNYHCFNSSHPDKNPSLVIYDKKWKCQSCGLGDFNGGYSNNVELVKAYLRCKSDAAIKWINQNFNCANEKSVGMIHTKSKSTSKKLHLRFINGKLKGNERFRFYPDTTLELRPPTLQDIDNIQEELGKSYSLETLNKAQVRINIKEAIGYALVFPAGQLEYNPHHHDQFLHLEGRTDYLTAIEMGLDAHYGIISDFNKTSKSMSAPPRTRLRSASSTPAMMPGTWPWAATTPM